MQTSKSSPGQFLQIPPLSVISCAGHLGVTEHFELSSTDIFTKSNDKEPPFFFYHDLIFEGHEIKLNCFIVIPYQQKAEQLLSLVRETDAFVCVCGPYRGINQ